MNALTIIQPYAELIARGEKRVENRRWSTSYRGPLAIHAGSAIRYEDRTIYSIAEDYGITGQRLIRGAIVAVVDMIDCVKVGRGEGWATIPARARTLHPWLIDHDHTEGPFCFVLANVRRLPNPIPMPGRQKFWTVDDAVIARAMPAGVR